ncbi:uncharacterized protein si:ch211-188c16.1 [Thalassophryne amazonica]|uniref:uncharacterized protein si:ch211-188c16.1 n=1 Tax=Thalassophryne amazonica TaxID=390379 RepID=UPI00147233F9|nr:uncharacterized protein si:ch211-188c16.1 [Thalassophryne amazonica]
MNFKALRAKFQEEAFLAQSKTSRPTVAEKPRYAPPPGGQSNAVGSSFNITVDKTQVVPRVMVRDALRTSGGQRPISFLPETQPILPSSGLPCGDITTRQSLKDRHMPLVLPALPLKDQKTESPTKGEDQLEPEPHCKVVLQNKVKKKSLLLPFKSHRAPKVSSESSEESTYADLSIRPASAPGELPSMEKHVTENGISAQGDQSNVECFLSGQDVPVTPLSEEIRADSDNRIMSTLEKAKKKFSQNQFLTSVKSKSFLSPDSTSADKTFFSLPHNTDSTEPLVPSPPPLFLPHIACISARPFFKVNNSVRASALDKRFCRDKTELSSVRSAEPNLPPSPPKKFLPALSSLGLLPVKPPRPPLVDLSRYHPASVQEMSPGLSQEPTEEPITEHPCLLQPVLDAPEFPDFENSEVGTADDDVDISELELEALDLVNLPTPDDPRIPDFEDFQLNLSICEPPKPSVTADLEVLKSDHHNLISLDQVSSPDLPDLSEIPDPPVSDHWAQIEGAVIPPLPKFHAEEAVKGAFGSYCIKKEMDACNHAAMADGIQTHPSVYQQDSYDKTSDNVYEDVENIHKIGSNHNSRKRKGSLKNPYANNHTVEEEASLNVWPRNPWGNVSGEHSQSVHVHIFSKEWHSPSTADQKEQKKREKHRLEKEKKEQKEREKKDNEMKKKFKVTGEEEPLYHAKVMVASKVRKNDLNVKTGDTVSIIRTTSCPKGKWLARDADHKYGYISVMNVELNINEMLELGKKAQAGGKGNVDGDTISNGSRSSNHPVLTSSFTDDSEEWAFDDETFSHASEYHFLPLIPATFPHSSAPHTLSDANLDDLHTQTRHEALQKLAIFFQHNKDEFTDGTDTTPIKQSRESPTALCAVEEPPYPEQEADFTGLEFLPPPPLYADTF